MVRIGIDLGGTKIAGIALDEQGKTLAATRVPTPQRDYAATVAAIVGVVRSLEAEVGSRASIGVGAPGSAGRSDRWRGANATWINGQPLEADIAAALGRDIRIANDANCFAVSEAIDGAGAGARLVFGVILGTGVGGGLALDGRVWAGRNGIAGEWGHTPLPWMRPDEYPGPPCFCGHQGCMEQWVSGRALERLHAAATGLSLRATEIAARAPEDERAAKILADYVDRLARGLAVVVDIIDPDVIVLGGGASLIPQLTAMLPDAVAHHAFSDSFDTSIRTNVHGDASGVRGAAYLWPK